MNFKLNDMEWTIKPTPKQWLVDKYNSEHEDKCTYAFGLCEYSKHIIQLNEELERTEMIRTLKHELTHCWLWSYGATYETYTEEEVCNKVSAMCDFIYKTTYSYLDIIDLMSEVKKTREKRLVKNNQLSRGESSAT